jgi:hypothetical protein
MNHQQLLIMAHKALNHTHILLEIFRNYFILREDIHNYNIRHDGNVYLTFSKLSIDKRCLENKAGMKCNKLPPHVNEYVSIRTFKCKIHNNLISLFQ